MAGKRNNWWYSFNIGNAHLISLSSSVVTAPTEVTNGSRYRWDYPRDLLRDQFKWLESDLAAANANRSEAPWVIVFAHFPMYCSKSSPDCTSQAEYMREGIPGEEQFGWEPLFRNYSVDMYISGHVHNYERHLPVYNG